MKLEIKLNPEFNGPTILELGPVLDETTGEVEVRWENTKPEIAFLKANPGRYYILNVYDIQVFERTCVAFGTSFMIDSTLLESARLALKSRRAAQNWEHISGQYGVNVSRGLLTRIIADSIRSGKEPKTVALVAREILLNGVNPLDASVLLRLREIRGH